MSAAERLELLLLLEEFTAEYLRSLESVSYQSFGRVNAPPEYVASLVTEVEDAKTLLQEFRSQIAALKKDPGSTRNWLLLLRNYYVVSHYLDDLSVRGLVKSKGYLGIRMVLAIVLDRIVIPAAN
jgi:hypothetical protein